MPIVQDRRVRRKVLQDYADKVCEIFGGWRIAVIPGDLGAPV